MDHLAIIRDCPLFKLLDDEQFERIARVCKF